MNCIAYGDMCTKHQVASYPQTMLYKDGEVLDTVKGGKPMEHLSGMMERALDADFPGTRPETVDLPAPGADSLPAESKTSSKTTTSTDSEKEPASADKAESKPSEKTAEKTDKTDTTDKTDKSGSTEKSEKPSKTTTDDAKKEDTKKDDKKTKAGDKSDASSSTWTVPFEIPDTKPTKPATTPNTEGRSVSLTAESFQQLVTMTQDPWFIKFYAPWCHHCQALAPNWQQLAKEMKGRLNIGEVNCDAESRLCKDVHVRGYPTIHFFKGGERVEYDGLRGLGDFIRYAEKAMDVSGGVPDVDAETLKAMEEKEDVIFVYFYDHAATTEDMLALERLPLSLIGRAKLVKTRDPALYDRFKITTWPRLIVSREGRPTYYTPLTPRDMRDTHQVLSWMKSVWLPIVSEMTASNAREIMDGKIVVLGILNREDQESFLGAKREMKSAANEWMDKQIQLFQLERQELRDAKQLRIEEAEDRNDQRALRAAKSIRINMDRSDRKEVAFAWVDGVFWQRWIRTTYGIDVKDGERVIINDEDVS